MAAYKPAHLDSALRSALDQSHRDLEVIVVDDSPGPDVAEIVRRIADPRIHYVRNATRQGPAASHARAIAEAGASVLGVLNDDDVWEPNLVARLLGALEESPEAVLAFADHWVMVDGAKDGPASDECSRTWKRDTLTPGLHRPFKSLALLDKTVPLAVAALFRRAAVAEIAIPAELGGAYDLFITYLLCRTGAGAVYVPERLSSWRVHTGSLSSERSCDRVEQEAAVLRILAHDPELAELQPALRAIYVNALSVVAEQNLTGGSRRHAVRAALAGVREGDKHAALMLRRALMPVRRKSRPR